MPKGDNFRTHGMRYHPLYKRWMMMKQRCENPRDKRYKYYGARGISVCERWHDFALFVQDMEPSFVPGLSIERMDDNGNYEPGNCVWATQLQQNNNSRKNRWLTLGDKTMTVSQWARETGIYVNTIYNRIKYGWPVDRVLAKVRFHKYGVCR